MAKAMMHHEEVRFLDQTNIEDARKTMHNFACQVKDDYAPAWHTRLINKKLDLFVQKKIKFLMIFMPPRHGKSEHVSRLLPAFIHGKYPDDEIMTASYSGSLAGDMTASVQRVMDSSEYKQIFPDSCIVEPGGRHPIAKRNGEGHNLIDRRGRVRRGRYTGQGIGGSFSGKGANWIIIDDPIKGRKQADSKAFRKAAWDFIQEDLLTRLEKDGQVLLTVTRWHEDDIAGQLLKAAKENPDLPQWEVLTLPAMCEEEGKHPDDPRKPGEALWPEKYPVAKLNAIKAGGLRRWTSLYQQKPTASEGTIIKRKHLQQFYIQLPAVTSRLISIDCSFKDSKTSSFVVFQCWGKKDADCYLIDQVRDQMDFVLTQSTLKTFCAKHPKALLKLVEDKANGPAIISSMKKLIPGLVAVEPEGSKEARLTSVSPFFEAGNIHLPDPSIARWVNDYIEELVSFPNADNDDQVDATSQALDRMNRGEIDRLKKLITL